MMTNHLEVKSNKQPIMTVDGLAQVIIAIESSILEVQNKVASIRQHLAFQTKTKDNVHYHI